jgi:virulence factor Mce-like protein
VNRRPAGSVAANPVLIGAATVLVVVVAVFLSYNANNGLPFVPTYQLTAQVPSAANLVVGNEVRLGGARVGVVDQITPLVHKSGAVTALLRMKLQTTVKPLSKDTSVLVRPRSALGLKYVQLTPGNPKKAGTFADGATIPLRNARPKQVEIDEVFNTFNAKTRAASARNLDYFSGALAGRGLDLNLAIRGLDPLLLNLIPVARNLADPRTQLRGFVRGLAQAAAEVAPVAEQQASLFRNLDTTFGALAQVTPQIQASITGGPPTLTTAIASFRVQRPFLINSTLLFKDLLPGARALARTAPTLSNGLVLGTEVLPKTVPLNQRVASTLQSVADFAQDPMVTLGINRLRQTAVALKPPLSFLAPAQTVCNYPALWFRNVSSLLSDGDKNGTWQRFIIILTPQGPNNEGGPASAPANGPTSDNHLHANAYPYTASPGQPKSCEAANLGPNDFAVGKTVIGHTPGNQGTNVDKTTIAEARK